MHQVRFMRFSTLMLPAAALLLAATVSLAAPSDSKGSKPAPAPSRPAPAAAPARPAVNNNVRPAPVNNGAGGFHPAQPANGTNGYRPAQPANGAGGYRPAQPVNGAGGYRPAQPVNGAGGYRPGGMEGGPRMMQQRTPTGFNRVARPNGDAFQRRADGRMADVHNARLGLDVHHGLMGGRRVEVVRPGGVRIVAERGRPGFVERPFARSFGGHSFAYRTYYYHGRPYERFYRGYAFHGVAIEVFAPAHYYSVGFYGWAYHPWGRPVAFGWGWGPSPWYGYYGAYFAPYPVYAGPNYWLTDYMIADDLQVEYQANQEAGLVGPPMMNPGVPMLTPEVKQMVSNEVAGQIALENYEAQQNAAGQDADPASSGIARLLTDGHSHVFVAGSDLDLVNAYGAECAITPGDVLQFNPPMDPYGVAANLMVVASKGGRECARGDVVTVSLNDLQEMENHMRQSIDEGLARLQTMQGQGGLPAAPAGTMQNSTPAQFMGIAPPPDPAAQSEITQQDAQAASAENEVASGS